ncbi:tRNA (guanosine(46)-N7)-methyltransferase TrmB [Helicobacter sp. 11S03491-1]|uniref:tRNA (guanosine(46)-N7)-methyltransferase TrmB n=1 Tax=Helicobacter sp. 11S03491-1 TaxID=1476196 RepID=UPI000BA68B33|nr:tRNA (guanosine(46)-N7)-methyltransferase TrmB [Helicobacter sp. 11S03491-1]PAF41972.1 tRNA (guanosine(46)-N7)-methyltransferase TrmB [Helicobacter sp. 11S03491-1]
MPHFLAQDIFLGELPFCDGGYEILYEAFSLKNPKESLIRVSYQANDFFVRKISRDKDILLKAEKITKPNPIGILKGALRVLSKKANVICHNLNNDSPKQTLQSKFFLKSQEISELKLKDFQIEIGFGSGRHLLKMAQDNPKQIYIGIEIHTPSIEQILRQIELSGLTNVYIVCADARILLEILPPNECEAIYVHFPIPWSKKPHRRVLNPRFLMQANRVLKKNASLELRTDDEEYFEDALKMALSFQNACVSISKNLSTEVVSKYEARWQKQQKDIFDLKIFSLQENQSDYKIEYDFKFDFLDLKNLCFPYRQQKIVKKDYFLHIYDVFKVREEKIILLISLGDFHWPINKIIIFDMKGGHYFGGNPLASIANIKAHQELLKILAEVK